MAGSGEHKFFVGGLDPKTTADAMRSRFEAFGTLSDCVVMLHPSGASRGFGFVEFESRQSYDDVLEVINNEGPEFELEGRMVSVKEADGKGGRRSQRNTEADGKGRRPRRNTKDREPSPDSGGGRRSSHLGAERHGDSRNRRGAGRQEEQRLVLPRDCRKLFLGGLSYRATQEDIEDAFSKFGEITDAIAMMGRDGKARGFGFVTFAQPHMAANAFRRGVTIHDKPLTIKPADGLGGGLDDDASAQQQPEPRRRKDRAPAPAMLEPSPHVDPKAFEKDQNKVYVKGVPSTVNDDRLALLFSEFGHVITASAQIDRGLGFVTFSSPQGPAKAVRRGSINVDGLEVEIHPYIRDKTKRGGVGGDLSVPAPQENVSRPLKRGREATSPKRREREPDNRRRRVKSPHAARERRGGQQHHRDDRDRDETEAQTINKSAAKLFVGGISQDTTPEHLRDYFLQFGELTDYVIMRGHRDGHRGFGFVTFEDEEVVAGVLNQPHELDGNDLTVKEADGEKPGKLGKEEPQPDKNKLFIGGISPSTTNEDLERVFSQYGSLNDVIALKGRGFGYVRFDDPAAAEQALQDEIEISGRIVSVRPCADPPRESARKRERR